MSTYTNTSTGLPAGTLTFIVFLILKLTHVITWSWWWVTAPLWIPVVLVVMILFMAVIVSLVREL